MVEKKETSAKVLFTKVRLMDVISNLLSSPTKSWGDEVKGNVMAPCLELFAEAFG